MNTHITINQFRLVKNHPYLRALADVSVAGFVLRGIKLEQDRDGQLAVAFPGRKIQGAWQVVCETEDPTTRSALLSVMAQEFEQAAA